MSVHLLSCRLSCVCDRLKDKGVGKDAEWGSLLEKAPLRHADDLDSATLSHAVDIFVERHHLLWKVQFFPIYFFLLLLSTVLINFVVITVIIVILAVSMALCGMATCLHEVVGSTRQLLFLV